MIKIDSETVIATFLNFCKEVEGGSGHGVTINGVKFDVDPIWKKILEVEGEEYLKEKLLSELYKKYALADGDYFKWLEDEMLDPQPTLVFNLLIAMSLYRVASENNRESGAKLRDVFYAFFNLILYNTLLGKTTKKGRSKKK